MKHGINCKKYWLSVSLLALLFVLPLQLHAAAPQGYVDTLNKDYVYGWARDQDCPDSPVAVHVYAYKRGSSSALWGRAITANVYRRDVGRHGFKLTDSAYKNLPEGEYEIVAYAIGKDSNCKNNGQNIALPLSRVGSEVNKTRQLIKKDVFGGGKYLVFSQYLGIMWKEANNYDMYQSAVRVSDNGTVFCYYTRSSKESRGETVYLRTSPNGITNWSNYTKVVDLGPKGTLDGGLIADGNVLALPENGKYRFWMHYTGAHSAPGSNAHIFQATTDSNHLTHFTKRSANGNVAYGVPMLYPSRNNYDQYGIGYGAGQPSLVLGGDNKYHMYFTDTSVEKPPKNTVIHLTGNNPMSFWNYGFSEYYANRMPDNSPVRFLNTAEWTYYPRLSTYAAVKLYKDARIWVGSTPTSFSGDFGSIIYDNTNPNRNYIAEGGLLRGLYGRITAADNSTIAYYGAGKNTGDWSRYRTTDSAATRYYLYKIE